MKKCLLILVVVIGFALNANAQARLKIGNGITLVSYGNSFSIENDNTQQCISLNVTQVNKTDGSVVYEILCNNKYTKGITKIALGTAIGTILSSVGQTWLTPFVASVANNIYDDVCNYYKEK